MPAIALTLLACAVPSSHALYRDGDLWPVSADGVTRIPVCFRTSGDYSAAEESRQRALVKAAISATWARWMQIEFSGFGECASPVPNATLSIKLTKYNANGVESVGGAGDIPDQSIHTSGHRGFQGATTPLYGWLQLNNVTVRHAWAVVVHEVGHALSFEHEQSRPDAVDFCPLGNSVLDGVVVTSAYDDVSAMNYCAPFDAGRISMLDIRGAQRLYGTSRAGRWLKALPALSQLPLW